MEQEKKQAGSRILEARAASLGELVSYQEGTIVSRTIIDQKTGTVTLFAFAAGQGLSEHTAPYDALVHVLDGEAEVIINGQPLRVHEGEAVIMPANHPHALRAVKNFKMVLTMIRS